MEILDARGRACPEPVVMTRKALMTHPEGAQVLVDNPCAMENITRYGKNAHYRVAVLQDGEVYTLTLTK